MGRVEWLEALSRDGVYSQEERRLILDEAPRLEEHLRTTTLAEDPLRGLKAIVDLRHFFREKGKWHDMCTTSMALAVAQIALSMGYSDEEISACMNGRWGMDSHEKRA